MAKKKIPAIVKHIRAYQLPEIDYSYQKNISFSQISMYMQCPKQWELMYIRKESKREPSIEMTFGTALHETLQHYLTVMYEQSGAAADRINTSEYLEESIRNTYLDQYKTNKQHFSSPEQIREYYNDGVEIIREFAKNKTKYFSKRGWYLVGCEIPITITPHQSYPNILFNGFIDVLMYHEPTETFKIIDIKTSRQGWTAKHKKDPVKRLQLVFYKKFLAEQFSIPLDKISVEFFIVKRKLWESEEYVIRRIQTWSPPSGKVKLNEATRIVKEFIENCFEKNQYKDKEHPPIENSNCKYCPFYKTFHCSATF